MLNWLKKTDYSQDTYNVDNDSTQWGNYKNSSTGQIQTAGSNENWKANNIYDIAGNVWEWTTEDYGKEAISRSGDALSNGNILPAGTRDHAVKSSVFENTGFRVVMYKSSGDQSLVNPPKLADGMTPVKWTGTQWQETTADDPDWYDYENKLWANVKLNDGSMLVWIPRYAYNITSNWHTNNVQDIQISFLTGKTNIPRADERIKISTESGQNKWLVHPAFKYGEDEIEGIWIAKYLLSNDSGIAIKPNHGEFTQRINEAYNLCIGLNDEGNKFGLSSNDEEVDPHLLKNTEWAAMIYLTYSKYGRNKPTSYSVSNTGAVSGSGIIEHSSTGNENGIFDLDSYKQSRQSVSTDFRYIYYYGNDLVAAYIENDSEVLKQYGESLINAPSKHKDVYQKSEQDTDVENYNINSKRYGDALYETSSQSLIPQYYPYGDHPFLCRSDVNKYMFAAKNMTDASINDYEWGDIRLDKYGNPDGSGSTYKVRSYYHTFYNTFRPAIVVY